MIGVSSRGQRGLAADSEGNSEGKVCSPGPWKPWHLGNPWGIHAKPADGHQ